MDCEEECCICLNKFKKETKKTLTCGHELFFCLNRMVVSKCPLCRDPIDLSKISKFNIGIKSKPTNRRVRRVIIINRHVHNNKVDFFMNLFFVIKSLFNC